MLIVDSIMSGLRESKMSFRRNIKICFLPGERIQHMYYYLVKLLRKRPDKIFLHVGTKNEPRIKVAEMLEELGKKLSNIFG